jgi:hypothetical protein
LTQWNRRTHATPLLEIVIRKTLTIDSGQPATGTKCHSAFRHRPCQVSGISRREVADIQ